MKHLFKRSIALLLTLAMLLTIAPLSVFATDTPGDPKVFELKNELKDGDQILIVYAAENKALGSEIINNYYKAGVDVAPADNKISTADTAIIWTVAADGEGFNLSNAAGEKLSIDGTYNSIPYDKDNDAWTLAAAEIEGCVNVVNQNGKHLSWSSYGNFTALASTSSNTNEAYRAMQIYVLSEDSPVPPTEPPTEPPVESDPVEILFLGTSDIHGQLYATDYTANVSASGTYRQGWTRVASYIKEQRAAYENVFLVDTGDTVQGTPLTYYFAFEEDTKEDPTVKMLRTLDYDMWVLGNHEFNYGLNILNEQMAYATSAPTEGEDTVALSVANYLAAETNNDTEKDWATWRGYAPYVIKEYDGVKVAIMGIGNPGVPMWDVPENWEGIYFANPIETYEHYEEEMKANADLIVIMSHSGIDSSDGTGYIRELIETHDSIDLAYSGHEHRDGVTKITDKSGKVVPVISPSTKLKKIGRALITFDKATGEYTINAENVNMQNYALDEETTAILKPYEDATWNDYMLQPIGKASGDFPASNLGTAPSAFMDLINQVQMYYAHDFNGENTPDDPTDDTPAQLSISAPLTSGSAANLIPAGDIVLGDMFRLYRYENWFYQIRMSGKEVRTWLEFAATKIKTNSDGTPTVSSGDLTYYDVIYGEGFSYVIDYTRPEGERVVSMTYNGAEVKDDDSFTAVVNNYRYNGGGNYVKYLNEHGCEDFIANDESRVIYSTQYDMIQGEDQGQARNMLANYIRMKGTIDPEITSTWKLEKVEDGRSTFEFAVVSTTDMHGRSTKTDVATQTEDTSSMVRAATIIKDLRTKYSDNMLLIDCGDTIQGNLVAQFAITQNATELNPMIEIMGELGYDAWVMGNHEFNFTPEQRDTQIAFASDRGIASLGANIVLLEDGKNINGEDVKAGDPFYTPYIIRTLTDDNGNEIKVAILGLGNAANATWDIASNYPNMQFSSLENETGSLAYEITKWVDYIEANEEADFVVVAAHSGYGNAEGTSLESQTLHAAANTEGVDMIIYGHDHSPKVQTVTNAAGEEIYIVNGGGSNVNETVFTLTLDENGEIADVQVASQNLSLKSVEGDEAIASLTQHWYDETYAWASAPLGTFDNGWTAIKDQAEGKNNNQMVTSQTALVDFVHKGQIWCSWQSYETEGIEGATVSIGSAVFGTKSGGVLSFVPTDGDTISTLELNKLYRYSNNLLCAVEMTGEQLYNWMSCVADKYAMNENGEVYLTDSVYGVDTFYGVDYTIDLAMPLGSRLVSATYNGVDLREVTEKIRVTLNSYRLSGGYGFFEATGLTEADCYWTASKNLGADRAPVPTQLGEYVAHMGTVSPTDAVSHGTDSTWKIVNGAETTGDTVILYTNDVHTYINNAADKGMKYSNVAALKAELEAEGKTVILVDAGDHVQGTAYGSMDKGETIIKLMNAAGYDLATLGNHEFDYGMARALELVGKADFPYVSANFYNEKDGVKGETVLDAYQIFEVDGVKIALVGITTPETFTKSTPAYFMDENGNYIYGIGAGDDGSELYADVQAAIDAAYAEGATYVIALGHLGDDPASDPWNSEDVIANVAGLHAFIDGHSHSTVEGKYVTDKEGYSVLLTQTGEYLKAIGKMTISKDGITTELITAYEGVDEEVKAIEDAWAAEVDTLLGEVIAKNEVDFRIKDDEGTRLIRKQETNLGDFAADALYYLFDVTEDLGVDVAIMNGGGIRADMPVGDVSYKTTKTVHTFGNVACLIEVTGQQILDALEWGAKDSGVGENGGFLHVSGVTYEIHNYIPSTVQKDDKGVWAGAPTGEYRVKNVTIGGEPLDVEKTYKLAGYNYTLRDLGDGFAMFDGAVNVKDYVMEDYMVLANYAKSFPEATIKADNSVLGANYGDINGEGRIVIVTEKECTHEWDEGVVTTEATCVAEGVMTFTCTLCGETKTEAIPATGEHIFENGTCTGCGKEEEVPFVNPFKDVQEGFWYYNYVMEAYQKGLVNGVKKDEFRPDENLTRAQFAVMLYRLLGEPTAEGIENPFNDLEADWYKDAVIYMSSIGVINGTGHGKFDPEENITREQMVTMLHRMAKITVTDGYEALDTFVDKDSISGYAVEPMVWAVNAGIINGVGKNKLAPQGLATRAEAAKVLSLFAEILENGY